MDENKLKEIFKKGLRSLYKNLHIIEFKAVQTNKFNSDSKKWEPNSYTIFLVLKTDTPNYNDPKYNYIKDSMYHRDVETYLEDLIGFECCIDIR